MKSISSGLKAHLAGELTTLALLVKVTRVDGVVKAFTSHDRDLSLGGLVYRADAALSAGDVESRAGLLVDKIDIAGILDSEEISGEDLDAGFYDFARVDVFLCNWADVSQGALQLRRGWLGEVTKVGNAYKAELRGLRDLLQRAVGDYYTAECRFDLGDGNCGVDLAERTVSGIVSGVVDRASFLDVGRTEGSGTFAYGKLTWTSGANAGQSVEVKGWDLGSQTFSLWLPMPRAIAVGDGYSVVPGCDKRFSTCRNAFGNGGNFGGFPYVPGVGNILKYPG